MIANTTELMRNFTDLQYMDTNVLKDFVCVKQDEVYNIFNKMCTDLDNKPMFFFGIAVAFNIIEYLLLWTLAKHGNQVFVDKKFNELFYIKIDTAELIKFVISFKFLLILAGFLTYYLGKGIYT